MINEKIHNLRVMLYDMVKLGNLYGEDVLNISREMDEVILEYYRNFSNLR